MSNQSSIPSDFEDAVRRMYAAGYGSYNIRQAVDAVIAKANAETAETFWRQQFGTGEIDR